MKPLTKEWVRKADGDFATASLSCAPAALRTMMPHVFMRSNVLKNI